MGEELRTEAGRLAQPPQRSVNPGSPAPKPANRNTASAGAGTSRSSQAAGGGSGTPAGAGKAEEKTPAGLAAVTAPPVPEPPKKKQTRKPKQKKQEPTSFNSEQISALIVSVSSIAASRPGLEMFAITKLEADQIAAPLSSMIAKNESLKGLSEHADAIALVTACFVVMVPRIMLYFDAQKAKQAKAAGGVKLVRTDEKRKTSGNGGNNVGTAPDAVPHDVPPLFAELPAIAD